MTEPENDRFVVSRTNGPYWILAGVTLCVAAGFFWMALAATQASPRVAGWVFGGCFGLLGLILVVRSLRKPVRNELVIEPAGISRVIGGVAWALRWDELRVVSVVKGAQHNTGHQVVLSPADDRFESPSRSLVRIAGGDSLVAGFELDEEEVPRVREVLAKHVGVTTERVPGTQVPTPSPIRPAIGSSSTVTIHVNGWDRVLFRWIQLYGFLIEVGLGAVLEFGPRNGFRSVCAFVAGAVLIVLIWLTISEQESHSLKAKVLLELSPAGLRWKKYHLTFAVSWPEIAELRVLSSHLEFRPVSGDFPLDRPELDQLRLADGWYRTLQALSPTAAKEFEAHIRDVLPAGVPLALGQR